MAEPTTTTEAEALTGFVTTVDPEKLTGVERIIQSRCFASVSLLSNRNRWVIRKAYCFQVCIVC